MSFVEFQRGDFLFNGGSVPVSDGTCRFQAGSGLVPTLKFGVSGYHKGTKHGIISMTIPEQKAGSTQDYSDILEKQTPGKVTFVASDARRYEVEGIIQEIDWRATEQGFVAATVTFNGAITVIRT